VCSSDLASGVGKSTVLTFLANEAVEQSKNTLQIIFEDTPTEIKRKHYVKWTPNETLFDFKDQVVCTKLDVDSSPGVASKYGIRNIPTILFFKGGEIVDKQVGAVPKSNLEAKLKPLL